MHLALPQQNWKNKNMAEFKFVLKCLGITAVLMFALQFEVHQGVRAEKYVAEYLRDGQAVVWVRDAMKGASLFVVNSSADLAPKLKLENIWPKIDKKAEELRNISSDIPVPGFPDEEVADEDVQKASVF